MRCGEVLGEGLRVGPLLDDHHVGGIVGLDTLQNRPVTWFNTSPTTEGPRHFRPITHPWLLRQPNKCITFSFDTDHPNLKFY